MKSYLKTAKNTKSLISLFLIFAFIYVIMCPFAHTLINSNVSQALIPQKQIIKNHFKQKDHISLPIYPFQESQIEVWIYDKIALRLPITTHQEPTFSLSIITTSRLVI